MSVLVTFLGACLVWDQLLQMVQLLSEAVSSEIRFYISINLQYAFLKYIVCNERLNVLTQVPFSTTHYENTPIQIYIENFTSKI